MSLCVIKCYTLLTFYFSVGARVTTPAAPSQSLARSAQLCCATATKLHLFLIKLNFFNIYERCLPSLNDTNNSPTISLCAPMAMVIVAIQHEDDGADDDGFVSFFSSALLFFTRARALLCAAAFKWEKKECQRAQKRSATPVVVGGAGPVLAQLCLKKWLRLRGQLGRLALVQSYKCSVRRLRAPLAQGRPAVCARVKKRARATFVLHPPAAYDWPATRGAPLFTFQSKKLNSHCRREVSPPSTGTARCLPADWPPSQQCEKFTNWAPRLERAAHRGGSRLGSQPRHGAARARRRAKSIKWTSLSSAQEMGIGEPRVWARVWSGPVGAVAWAALLSPPLYAELSRCPSGFTSVAELCRVGAAD